MLDASFWVGRRVLLTGHTGFKGSWLLLWLQQLGAQVWTFALEPEGERSLFCQLEIIETAGKSWFHQIGNLADLQTLKLLIRRAQPEVVFHLAAQPLVRRSYEDPLGTWSTNVIGSLNLLEALKFVQHPCSVVMVTTDKVYENREWVHGYREPDRLGGHDPYSASKAGAEIAIASWRSSFCGASSHQTPFLRIATARAGNVIGGGDWSVDRIVPDAVRSLELGESIPVRNPRATRPWQHVIEPLSGYLRLAEALALEHAPPCEAFNFGPTLSSNRSVGELVKTILDYWPGEWIDRSDPSAPHEANFLHLHIDKSQHKLGWEPQWNFSKSVEHTINWYRKVLSGSSAFEMCLSDLRSYELSCCNSHFS